MSTATQSQHWEYTINEWKSQHLQIYLSTIFKNNDIKVIYDIGANVGGTTYIFTDYCNNNNINIEKIYCFEPDIDNINYLKYKLNKDIENNKIICVNTGIYYGKTEAKVFGAGHCSHNRIHPNVGGYGIEECMIEIVDKRNKNGEEIFCAQVDNKVFKLDTLENLCIDFLEPDFIKIDVEGAEKNILKHSNLIKKAKFIILEWNHGSLEDFLINYLPEFEIISSTCDFLLKNKSYKY